MTAQSPTFRPTCPDCGARVGAPHVSECDVERCTVCGGQRWGDTHAGHDRQAAAWTGEWPGVLEARARGWYAIMTSSGWRPVPAGTPGAAEDLNRWAYFSATGRDDLYTTDRLT